MKRKDRAGCGGRATEISRDFEQFLSLRLSARRLGVDPGRRSKTFQNLLGWPFLVTCGPLYGLFVGLHVRSFMFRVIYLSLVVGGAVRRSA